MKDNKVNVDLIVPSVGGKYNIFIPVNKTVGEVILILNNTINEFTKVFPKNNKLVLLNVNECKIYNYETQIINTEIRNGTILALL